MITVNEAIKKLRELKKDGKITGDELLVGDFSDMDSLEVKQFSLIQVKTVRFTEGDHLALDRIKIPVGKIVDGRGKPTGTQRVVRFI